MTGTWKEVVRLRFKGERFRDRALDLTALTELRQFQKIVAETAKALWRAAHPDRERLPAHFEDRTRLCLRRIEEGSAVTPLEVWLEDDGQGEFWEDAPKEVQDAVVLARDVFDHLDQDLPLPERFPKELLSDYAEWGKTLGPNEEVEFEPADGESRPARLTVRNRDRLAGFVETPHSSTLEISGHVLEADVRQRRFQSSCAESRTCHPRGVRSASGRSMSSGSSRTISRRSMRRRGRSKKSFPDSPRAFPQGTGQGCPMTSRTTSTTTCTERRSGEVGLRRHGLLDRRHPPRRSVGRTFEGGSGSDRPGSSRDHRRGAHRVPRGTTVSRGGDIVRQVAVDAVRAIHHDANVKVIAQSRDTFR